MPPHHQGRRRRPRVPALDHIGQCVWEPSEANGGDTESSWEVRVSDCHCTPGFTSGLKYPTGLCHCVGSASLWTAQGHPLHSDLLILQGPSSNLINSAQPFLLSWKKGVFSPSESPLQERLAALCYGHCNHP